MGVREADRLVIECATRQHGVFRRDQAVRAGLSNGAIARRAADGAWERIHDGVYRLAGTPLTQDGALLAGCFAAGPTALASHRSAARLWGLPGGRFPGVEITCARWRRAQHREDLIVHETIAIDHWDRRVRDGIPTTSVERTLLDLGAVVGPALVEMAVDAALHRKLVTIATLRGTLGRLGRSGRNGAGVLRAIVDPRDPSLAAPESPKETQMLQVLRRHGFPPPVPQFEIYDGRRFLGRVDAAYPAWKIVLEYQSVEHHVGSAAVLRDEGRRSDLLGVGWTTVPVTLDDLRTGGERLARAIRGVLASRSPTSRAILTPKPV